MANYSFFLKKILDYKNFFDTVEIRNDKYIDLKEYIDLIVTDKKWATELDITISSLIYFINIAIYQYSKNFKRIDYIHLFTYEDNLLKRPLMILINGNYNHF